MSLPPPRHDPALDAAPLRLAIFCRVVDNYGDAGVCWRLARQLALEHRARVVLWIDRPQTLAAIAPAEGLGPGDGTQDGPKDGQGSGVRVRAWDDAAGLDGDEQVVVSAFGCELPPPVRQRLAAAGAPLWVNLEYLSAEDWVDGCHGLASTKPADGAVEHFFYPGFGAATGGLLREADLLAERDAFLAGSGPQRWLHERGLAPPRGARTASLFCYPDAPAEALFRLLAAGSTRWHLLVPADTADAAMRAFLGAPLAAGVTEHRGMLTLHRFELLAQPDYDRLLWSCDLNFVRGEDSWVRAHWAGRPFVWQPYPQDAGTRLAKLDAFLGRMTEIAGPMDEAARMMHAWCGPDTAELAAAWAGFEAALPRLEEACGRWASHLGSQRDLADRLVEFCQDRL